jgi:hypothetical protein
MRWYGDYRTVGAELRMEAASSGHDQVVSYTPPTADRPGTLVLYWSGGTYHNRGRQYEPATYSVFEVPIGGEHGRSVETSRTLANFPASWRPAKRAAA